MARGLVDPVCRVAVSPFFVREHFVVGDKNGVLICRVSDRFNGYFCSGDTGKIECGFEREKLRGLLVVAPSMDDRALISYCGGQHRVEVHLGSVYKEILRGSRKSEDGVPGRNLWYTQDMLGILRVVLARELDDGWDFDAFPLNESGYWDAGTNLVCRSGVAEYVSSKNRRLCGLLSD